MKCEKGHSMESGQQFCPQCGSPPKVVSTEERLEMVESQMVTILRHLEELSSYVDALGLDDVDLDEVDWEAVGKLLKKHVPRKKASEAGKKVNFKLW